jgi:hypothetical protein
MRAMEFMPRTMNEYLSMLHKKKTMLQRENMIDVMIKRTGEQKKFLSKHASV